MSLTRIDCQFFRGKGASLDKSSFVVLNPHLQPGSLVVASAKAVRDSISSQVACRLALEHFIDGVLDFYHKRLPDLPENGEKEISIGVLEAAFKRANGSVYSFGHKLAAGGRMSASLLGLVLEDSVAAAGRVGSGSIFLYRGSEVFPFFEEKPVPPEKTSGVFVGAQSLVSVELASVQIMQDDRVLVFSEHLDDDQLKLLRELLKHLDLGEEDACALISQNLFPTHAELPFVMLASIGPDTIYLGRVVE